MRLRLPVYEETSPPRIPSSRPRLAINEEALTPCTPLPGTPADAGHTDLIYDNDCVILDQERVDDLFDNCRESGGKVTIRGSNNRFYTPLANATVTCDCCGKITLAELARVSPFTEANASSFLLPTVDTVVSWARAKTGLPPA